MKTIIAAAALCLFATAATAQSAEPPSAEAADNWEGEIEFSIGPRLGKEQPFDTSEELVDESEAELSVAVRRTLDGFPWQLQLKAGMAWSPQYFDDGDPESGLYSEASIGDTYVPLRQLLLRGKKDRAKAVEDGLRPYARYRFTRVHNQLLGNRVRDEHQATFGLRFRDVRTIMCERELPPADMAGACTDTRGVYWEARAEINRIWSTDPNEERVVPSLRVDLYSRPLAGEVRIFGQAQIEARFYEQARDPVSGGRREDLRLRLGAGLDLSGLSGRVLPGLGLELMAQFQRRWSNDDTKEHKRFYFIPSLTLTKTF